jgi:hypothetical protein
MCLCELRRPSSNFDNRDPPFPLPHQSTSGGQNDDFRPLTYTLGGRGMECRDKYVTY